MYYSQKKPYKNNYPKPKHHEADRWDHSGYEQLQQETDDKYYRDEKGNKIKKTKVDNTMAADNVEHPKYDKRNNPNGKKWSHDKFDDNNHQSYQPHTEGSGKPDYLQRKKKGKKT
jgi:hypothetical protein